MAGAGVTGEVAGARVTLQPVDGGFHVWAGDRSAGAVRLNQDGESATIESLCIDEQLRGYGLGSDAARTLMRWLREEGGATRIRAWAPPDRGLAVYFWFRMGFRPVHGEGPDGGLWLERVSGDGASA